MPTAAKATPTNHDGKAVQKQRRHREIVAELFEARGKFRHGADPCRDGEEADQRQQAEHEGVTRQHRGVAADGAPARGGKDAGDGVWIEEQRQRRAERQRSVDAIGAGGVGAGRRQQELRRRHRRKDMAEAAELDRHHDHRGKGGDVDQNILDDGDRGRCPQPARIGERREDDEGDDQRQVGGKAGAADAHGADHHLQADQLQRDVRHSGDDAGDGDRQRQPAIAEAAADEIGRRDVIVLVADMPKPRKYQEQDRIDHDRVRHREEGDGAGAEGERRDGDEGVGRVEVAADQEPSDDGAEAPPAQAPFVQLVEIALAPMRGGKTQPRDEAEQRYKDDQGSPVHVLHGVPPRLLRLGFLRFWLFDPATARDRSRLRSRNKRPRSERPR